MTVSELIDKLKALPQDAEVQTSDCLDIIDVSVDVEGDFVYLGDEIDGELAGV